MTEKPFKFRRVHEIAGAFVLTTILLAAGLVLVAGRLQGWFEQKTLYEVVLPREGLDGIRPGSEVRILGSRAGVVSGVELRQVGNGNRLGRVNGVKPDEIELVAMLEVRGDRSVFVGEESQAVVRRDLAGFGASYVDITRGSTRRMAESGPLPLTREADVTNELTGMVRELQEALLPAAAQVSEAYAEVERLAAVMVEPEGDFRRAMAAFQEVMTGLNRGEGALGMLLREENTAEDLERTLAGMREAVEVLNVVLRDFERGEGAAGVLFRNEEVKGQVEATVAKVEETASALPGTVRATNATLAEIRQATLVLQEGLKEYEYVAEAMQRHWLLRRYVVRDEETGASGKAGRRDGTKPGESKAGFELGRKVRGVIGSK